MTVKVKSILLIFILLLTLAIPQQASGQNSAMQAESATVSPDSMSSGSTTVTTVDPVRIYEEAVKPERLSTSLEIMILMTVLALVPSILVMMTSFTRIIIVLGLLRQAMGTQQLPPSQVITALALFMTFFIMAPTWNNINADAITPYVNPAEGQAAISQQEMWSRTIAHMRTFMIKQIEATGNTDDVYMFVSFDETAPELGQKLQDGTLQWKDVSTAALIPAFMTSELKQAFLMGFYIYLPFLVIDMVISSILMSMGMMMLPPVMISMPFKLLLFVMVDGWQMIVGNLIHSFTSNPPVI